MEENRLTDEIIENEIEEIEEIDGTSTSDVKEGNAPKKAKYAVLSLITLALFTKVFGFLREIVFANYYGTSDVADVYKVIQKIPLMILVFVGTGFDTGFIPLFNKVHKEKGEKAAEDYMSKVMTLVVIITTIISLLVMIFPKPVIYAFASGFSEEKMAQAVNLIRIAILCIIFAMLRYIVMPYLQIRENFTIPALVGIPMNLIQIASFPIGYYFGIKYLAIGLVLSEIVQLAFVYPFARREGYRYKPLFDIKDENIKKLFVLAAPIILSVAVAQINVLVDQNMASRVEPNGGIAALDYANRLSGFVQGLFIYSVISVLYPRISKLFVKKDKEGISKMLTEAFVIIGLAVTPCMVGIMVLARQITAFVFLRGQFGLDSLQMTSDAMFYYALSLVAFGFREILVRIFYSMNDTKTPMINSVIAVSMNIFLNILLSSFMGLKGLALATSISTILVTILLTLSLHKKGGVDLKYRELGIKLLKILISSIIMGIAVYASEKMFTNLLGDNIGLIAAILVAGIVYLVAILLAKIPEVEEVKNKLISKIRI